MLKLNPQRNEEAFGRWGRWLGHEVDCSWMGLVPWWRRPQRAAFPLLSSMWGHGKVSHLQPGRGPSLDTQSAWALILDSATPETLRNRCLLYKPPSWWYFGLPRWLSSQESTRQSRRHRGCGLTPGSGRSPGGGNSNLLWYSCLGNPMDTGAQWATVHEVANIWPQLSMHARWYFVGAAWRDQDN